jgi:hypothetical protein
MQQIHQLTSTANIPGEVDVRGGVGSTLEKAKLIQNQLERLGTIRVISSAVNNGTLSITQRDKLISTLEKKQLQYDQESMWYSGQGSHYNPQPLKEMSTLLIGELKSTRIRRSSLLARMALGPL